MDKPNQTSLVKDVTSVWSSWIFKAPCLNENLLTANCINLYTSHFNCLTYSQVLKPEYFAMLFLSGKFPFLSRRIFVNQPWETCEKQNPN